MLLRPRLALVLLAAPLLAQPVKTLVVTGGHDHHPAFYTAFDDPRLAPNVDPHPVAFRKDVSNRYDVAVLYDLVPEMDDARRANLKAFADAGKGIVVLHHAICSHSQWPWYSEELVGGRYRFAPETPLSTYKHDEQVKVTVVKKHPVTEGVDDFIIHDETYKNMWISPKVQVLLRTDNPTADGPIAWIGLHPKARIVYLQLGHDENAHRNPNFQRLVRNAILWAAGRN
jgi:hypothetical protein